MILKTRFIGSKSARIIELIIDSFSGRITEDVTNLDGTVDENLIINLRDIANELEEHNRTKLKNL